MSEPQHFYNTKYMLHKLCNIQPERNHLEILFCDKYKNNINDLAQQRYCFIKIIQTNIIIPKHFMLAKKIMTLWF